MRKGLFSIMAGALAMAGCVKDMDQSVPVQSDYLVIEASCALTTKTDINEGQSAWEEGDKITVVYNGAAYEYVASAAGETTTFTSTAGITGYDASKPIVAYYPVTDAAGTVKVEAEKTIAFKGAEQVNSSCAPLVGTPKDDNLANGSLSMLFENVFSVLELRIDAGELSGTAKSVTVSPASAEGFSGYLSVSGTVDPATLAVTAATTGNSVKVNLPANADPKNIGIKLEDIAINPKVIGNEINIINFKEFLMSTGLVEYAEGHPNAFGAGIKDCNI